MVANGQQPVTYGYDAASRLTQVAQGSLEVGLGYDNVNRRTTLTYPNGTSTSYGYDIASRLTGITHLEPNGIIEALTYQYDAAGNRTSLTRNNGTASLLPAAVVSATYDAANEQTAFAGVTLQYDANGNLTNDGVNTYAWDARNRLVAISGGSTASFNYDALGRRTSKTINSVGTQFAYDGNDISAEIGGGAVGANYYEPFGKTTASGTSSNTVQYTGRENDGTGLYYYRARYYQPKFQRFVSEDPAGFLGRDANLYAYVFGNPLRLRDPLGLLGNKGPIDVFSPSSGTVTVDASLAQFLTPNSVARNAPMTSADSRALAGTAAGTAAVVGGVALIGAAAIPAAASVSILTTVIAVGEVELILHGLGAAGVAASAALVNGMLGVMAVDAGLNMIPIGCRKCSK